MRVGSKRNKYCSTKSWRALAVVWHGEHELAWMIGVGLTDDESTGFSRHTMSKFAMYYRSELGVVTCCFTHDLNVQPCSLNPKFLIPESHYHDFLPLYSM